MARSSELLISPQLSLQPERADHTDLLCRQVELLATCQYMTEGVSPQGKMVEIMNKTFVNKIKGYFKSKKGTVVVYVFGSYAQKRVRRDSDVDLAVLFEKGFIPPFDQLLEMKSDLSSLLKKEVDLIVLNSANPVLKHQIYKYGEKVIVNNKNLINAFFVQSLMEYADLKMVRSIIEKKILNRRCYG